MSIKNKELTKMITEAFFKGNTEFILHHLAEDIQWNIVGMPVIFGKSDVIRTMELINPALAGCPDLAVKNIIAEGDYVVVESSGNNYSSFVKKDTKEKQCSPAYCDVYRFKNGKIQELTTYIVDTASNSES